MRRPPEREVLDVTVVEELVRQDGFVNEKSRRLIVSALEACPRPAPFAHLKRATGLSDGNISGHLTKLENRGLITVGKWFEGRRPRTPVSLTDEGRAAIEDYWRLTERFLLRRRMRPGKRPGGAGCSDASGGPGGGSRAGRGDPKPAPAVRPSRRIPGRREKGGRRDLRGGRAGAAMVEDRGTLCDSTGPGRRRGASGGFGLPSKGSDRDGRPRGGLAPWGPWRRSGTLTGPCKKSRMPLRGIIARTTRLRNPSPTEWRG